MSEIKNRHFDEIVEAPEPTEPPSDWADWDCDCDMGEDGASPRICRHCRARSAEGL